MSKSLIIDPYSSVDWNSFSQYKASFHNHHNLEYDEPEWWSVAEMVDYYHSHGFQAILTGNHSYPWEDHGRNPAQLGMLPIQQMELKGNNHHTLALFCDYTGGGNDPQPHRHDDIEGIEQAGGIAFFTHPGRYFNSWHGSDRDKWDEHVNWYVPYYDRHENLIGQEVFNKGFGHQPWGRRLWDRLIEHYGANRPIWGMSGNDARRSSEAGYNVMRLLMPEFTEVAVRNCLVNGAYYFGYDPVEGRHEIPIINNISTNNETGRIQVYAEGYDEIEWWWRERPVARGDEIFINELLPAANYVRLVLRTHRGAVTFTNPWLFEFN